MYVFVHAYYYLYINAKNNNKIKKKNILNVYFLLLSYMDIGYILYIIYT